MAMLKENILFLTLKEPYFNQIEKRIKKYEYRNITNFFIKKLSKKYDFILFQNGYSKQSPRLLVEFLGVEKHILKDTNSLFESQAELFAIKLGEIIEFSNELIYNC
ncbi:MAG: hypothetical protein KA174_09510 [Chitinophagales bacterium]|nr:hypothetical protein [Chitinophagales bacterium]